MPRATYPFMQLHEGARLRPYLPIEWYNPHENKTFIAYSLADTGADSCVLPGIIATQTGHNINGTGVLSEVSQGVGGVNVRTWKHTFRIRLKDLSFRNVFWESEEQLIDCVEHSNIPPLLGVANFLSNFIITFDYKNSLTILEY